MSRRARTALVAALTGALLGAWPAHASPGWSSGPRWRIPQSAPPRCPQGWDLGDRRLLRQSAARCARPATPPVAGGRRIAPAPWVLLGTPLPTTPVRPEPPRAPERPEPPRTRTAPSPPSAAIDASQAMAMSPAACQAHLRAQGVRFRALREAEAPEVEQPIRLTGPLADVEFRIPWSKAPDRDHHAIWDCRLVAAMLPVARWLHERGIAEVHYFSVLRRGEITRRRPRSQHNVGLAIDILGLVPRDGSRLDVEDHYPKGRLRGCPPPRTRRHTADLYTALVCATASHGWVHTVLTPDYDRAHHNHLHLDLSAGQASPPDPFVSFARPSTAMVSPERR